MRKTQLQIKPCSGNFNYILSFWKINSAHYIFMVCLSYKFFCNYLKFKTTIKKKKSMPRPCGPVPPGCTFMVWNDASTKRKFTICNFLSTNFKVNRCSFYFSSRVVYNKCCFFFNCWLNFSMCLWRFYLWLFEFEDNLMCMLSTLNLIFQFANFNF